MSDFSSSETPNPLMRDRFELLSAYLDGEVTATERRQVEEWLKTDVSAQRLYARLLHFQQGMRRMPIPASGQPVEQTVQQVVSRLERKPKNLTVIGGMAAIAAIFVGAVVSNLPRGEFFPQFAAAPVYQQNQAIPSDGLMIALDKPLLPPLPKEAVSSPTSAQ
ncbi:MAG: zf-HC2 domain-containing protein [Oculatellaceae cyanobacterium Prado106]|nr:zf-HC2 domain-containing protein [Oculatellaceae cyanobacterium Prado106]